MSKEKKGARLGLRKIIIFIVLLAAVFVSGMLFRGCGKQSEPEISSELIANQINEISELSTLKYRYTNVGKFSDAVDFYGWEVPFTTKSFIVTYEGSMKLGIDCRDVKAEVSGSQIKITLPPIKILSHEVFEDSLEVMDQTKNVFNVITIDDYNSFAADSKEEMEAKAQDEGLFAEALESAKKQISAFVMLMPGTEDYSVVFID